MKKLAILAAAVLVTGMSSFAQGFFIFANSTATAVYEPFTTASFARSPATVYVALLYSTDTNAVPLAGATATPTNSTTSGDWSKVMSDPNFVFAQRTGTNLLAKPGTGGFSGVFNGGTVGIDNTVGGQTIKMYAIAWEVSAGNAPGTGNYLGHSNPFIFTLGTSSSPAGNLAGQGMQGFGVQPVPEPSTFALAGLGAAAMLIFRRRK